VESTRDRLLKLFLIADVIWWVSISDHVWLRASADKNFVFRAGNSEKLSRDASRFNQMLELAVIRFLDSTVTLFHILERLSLSNSEFV